MPDVLLVAATERELGGQDGLVCGIGPVEAAAATARALAQRDVGAVLHIGVAGGRGLDVGSLVIGSEAIYCDLAAAIRLVDRVQARRAASRRRSKRPRRSYRSIPIGTSAAVGGVDRDLAVEAMEGFGVLRAAALAGVPALEVRAISNEIGEPDRSRWRVDEAIASLTGRRAPARCGHRLRHTSLTVRSRSMARPRYPSSSGARPPALSPVARTVGQLVAETLQVYGKHFWVALPLGLVVAIADQASFGLDLAGRIVVLLVAAPFFSAAFAVGAALVGETRPSARTWAVAILVGTVVFLPAAFLFPWFALAAIVVLALFGNAVPAIVMEGRSPLGAVRRSIEVARADLVHALAGLATLVIMFGIVRLAMGFLLRQQADNTLRVAIFLADTVLGPVLFLGAALLFVDLRARVGTTREERLAARRAEHSAAK